MEEVEFNISFGFATSEEFENPTVSKVIKLADERMEVTKKPISRIRQFQNL